MNIARNTTDKRKKMCMQATETESHLYLVWERVRVRETECERVSSMQSIAIAKSKLKTLAVLLFRENLYPHIRKTYARSSIFHSISLFLCQATFRFMYFSRRIYIRKSFPHLRWADEMKVNKPMQWTKTPPTNTERKRERGTKKWNAASAKCRLKPKIWSGKECKSVENKILVSRHHNTQTCSHPHKLWWFNANVYFP